MVTTITLAAFSCASGHVQPNILPASAFSSSMLKPELQEEVPIQFEAHIKPSKPSLTSFPKRHVIVGSHMPT